MPRAIHTLIIPLFIIILINNYVSGSENLLKISPADALEKLKMGNIKFYASNKILPDLTKDRRLITSKNGQHPYAVILSCSDSRVPPEHIFNAGIGDLFVIRVAGNVADVDEIGSAEYGTEHLSSPVLLVLGHTSCGAVTAVLKEDKVAGSIPQLVDNIIPSAEKAKSLHGEKFSTDLLNTSIKMNVFQSIEDLIKKSKIIRERILEGELRVVGAVYDIETGIVEWMGEHPYQEKLLNGTLNSENILDKHLSEEQNKYHSGVDKHQELVYDIINNKKENLVPVQEIQIYFQGKKAFTTSPRDFLYLTVILNTAAEGRKAKVNVYARKTGKGNSILSKDLIFTIPEVFLQNGRGQTQFYWAAKNYRKQFLEKGKYLIVAEIDVMDKKGIKIKRLTHSPKPQGNYLVTVN